MEYAELDFLEFCLTRVSLRSSHYRRRQLNAKCHFVATAAWNLALIMLSTLPLKCICLDLIQQAENARLPGAGTNARHVMELYHIFRQTVRNIKKNQENIYQRADTVGQRSKANSSRKARFPKIEKKVLVFVVASRAQKYPIPKRLVG